MDHDEDDPILGSQVTLDGAGPHNPEQNRRHSRVPRTPCPSSPSRCRTEIRMSLR
jgi:hypothetical protein